MNCPVCVGVELVMSDRQGVEIDYCPKCRGVWLDRGELDKIVERSSKESHSRDEREHREPRSYDDRKYGHSEHDHRKKKKGFLGDLFDF